MSPPVFLLDPDRAAEACVGSEVVLDGPEGRHAVAVQRVRAGEMIQCVDGYGRRITGSVATVHVRFRTSRSGGDPPMPRSRSAGIAKVIAANARCRC